MMQKVIVLIIFTFSALLSSAQKSDSYDTLKILCEGPIFTLSEKMPRLKNGNTAFEDSLKQYLKNINEFPRPCKVSLTLAILKSGEVKYAFLTDGTVENLDGIIKALKSLSYHWSPAIQNGHIVCCYRPIELEFSQDKVAIKMVGRS